MNPPEAAFGRLPPGGAPPADRRSRFRGVRWPDRRAQGGFTLVEVMVTCALVGVVAGVALPNFIDSRTKGRRADAVAALTRVQAAQERYRANNGFYSSDFGALGVADRSPEGWYALAVQLNGPDGYRATAAVVAGAAQQGDSACPQLVLDVAVGFAERGPDRRCWNR